MARKALKLEGVYITTRDFKGKPAFVSANQTGLEVVLSGGTLMLNHSNFLAMLRLWSEEFGVVDEEEPGEIELGLQRLEQFVSQLPKQEQVAL